MPLTGRLILLVTVVLLAGAAVATVRLWRVPGRKRIPLRITGLVLVELLVVAGAGLAVNRSEQFYPSWEALTASETVVTVAPLESGKLDGKLDGGRTITWTPAEAAGWHLAAAPLLVTPAGYATPPVRSFPVAVALTTVAQTPAVRAAAAAADGVLTLVLAPTRDTTASALAGLPGLLAQDARVMAQTVVLAGPSFASLAAAWPGRPSVITGFGAAQFADAARVLPAPLTAPQKLPA